MLKELMILRHGHVVDAGRRSDACTSRPLSDKGKRNAQRMGVWMAANASLPDHLISSPAEAAKSHAEKLCKAAGLSQDLVRCDPRLNESDPDRLFGLTRDVPAESTRMLLVGHHPSLSRFAESVCEDSVAAMRGEAMAPGALFQITIDCEWNGVSSNCGKFVRCVAPKALPRLFPYPGADGTEHRTRPAYYYRQSSVIPYRVLDGQLEVLIVSSSKKKHWVVPKGIHDPGKSAQASAACEAREEAGALGQVGETDIGVYSYTKWDATCTVTVFPMKVTQLLPEDQWEERHRGRRWVSPKAAAKLVRNAELAKIICRLPAILATHEQK